MPWSPLFQLSQGTFFTATVVSRHTATNNLFLGQNVRTGRKQNSCLCGHAVVQGRAHTGLQVPTMKIQDKFHTTSGMGEGINFIGERKVSEMRGCYCSFLLLHLQKGPKRFECLIDRQRDSTKHSKKSYYLSFSNYSKKLKREHLQTPSTRPAWPKPKTLLKETEKEN